MAARALGSILLMGSVFAGGTALAATPPGNQGANWADIARLPPITGIYETARLKNAPRDGQRDLKPVFTAKAAAEQATYAAKKIEDSEAANCLPPGMPGIMTQPYPIQMLMTPGEVTIIQEAYMQVRHVHMDGREHPADPDLTFNGDSNGHWEGDTLVVDTVGLAPQAVLAAGVQHSKGEHIVERFRLSEPDLLEVRTRIEDPGVLEKPWEFAARYARHKDWSLAEYICEQNNRNSVDASGKANINLELKK